MEIQRKPVTGEYLICSSGGELAEEKLLLLDDFIIKRIPELENTYIARSKDNRLPEDLVRQKLRDAAGAQSNIMNVLVDDDGHKLFPTGNISILLTQKISNVRLNNWIANHNLTLVSRSKWRPSAIMVSPALKTENLDQVVQKLRKDPMVEIAEQDVLLRFVRE